MTTHAALAEALAQVLATWSEATAAGLPDELARVLAQNGITTWTTAGDLPSGWLPPGATSADVFLAHAERPGEMRLGCVELAALGVAETGSMVTHGDREQRQLPMLCDVQVILVRAVDMVPDLDTAATRIAAMDPPPPHLSFITGASRTSDIERTLTIGVHGPSRVHVVVVTE